MVKLVTASLAAAALAASLVACGSDSVDAKTLPRAAAIDYDKSGGIAGVHDHLHIAPGGKAILKGGYGTEAGTTGFRVGPRRLAALRKALATARFGTIPPESGPTGCADCFVYSVTYRGHTVTRDEIDVPERLAPVLRQLQAIIDAHPR